MVFMSRYGFYRNVAFLCVVSAILDGWLITSSKHAILSTILWIMGAWVFKKRAEDFYSYLAPNVYRSFLIDKAFGKSEGEQT